MSSTKITEFDLDPNMDMAKESSLQEVKTAVENIPNNLPDDIAKESTSQEILDKVEQGVEVNLRSPVSVKQGTLTKDSTASASGTGKGILTISGNGQATLTVDGVTLLSNQTLNNNTIPFTIEFKSSFVITESYGNKVYYAAVFY